ncbi:hypothetical protein [Actibacterium atlanticum]|uniref:AbiU2 domain-containing protein n=1 Tax=Actibacterium atlanticum TaxID=1461693 RepID=UPI0012DF576E|nr:hypothetical protein [Actibacterium atlanticum]
MTDELEVLRGDFSAFRDECVWCRVVFNTHQALFDQGDEVDQVLRESAAWFFHDYSVISQEYHVVQVGRLTERADNGRNRNLTVEHIENSLESLEKSSDEVSELARRLVKYRGRIDHSRNKLVAHRDVPTLRKPRQPRTWPSAEVYNFFSDLNAFCDAVANQIGMEPLDFSATPAKGDALDLIKLLRSKRASEIGSNSSD